MSLLDWFGGDSDEDDEFDSDYLEWEDREVEPTVLEFTRKTYEFTFVRGTSEDITWDEWFDHSSKGINETRRNGQRVERFYLIAGGSVGYGDDGLGVSVMSRHKEFQAEVVTGNVASRKPIEEKQMELVVPTVRRVGLHPETGKAVKRGWHKKDPNGEPVIREVNS